jgi:hypothetical protein
MLASLPVNEVATILNDMEPGSEHLRWPVPELLNYLSEAINAVVQGKPALFVAVVQLPLAPGSTQRLPEDYSRILDIHFNVNADGTEGPNVLPGVYNLQQAFQKPGCPSSALIEVFSAYPGSERYFWVDPPVPRNLSYTPKVEALVMLAPQPVTSIDQPIVFPGASPQLYQSALVDWMLYRCYSKDQESATSFERSQAHFKAFQQYVGMSVGAPMQQKKSSGAMVSAPTQQPRAA